MGNQHTNARSVPLLQKEEIENLSRTTHYDKKEIRQLFTQFVEEAPAGYIPRDDFCQLADIMGIRDKQLCDLLFRAIDTDCDGRITFVELLRAMSIMTRGDSQEKLKFVFDIYDLDRDGFITRNEMCHIVYILYHMMGDLVQLQGELQDPNRLVNRLFEEMDTNNDNRLSFAEFSSGVLRDAPMARSMNLY